MHQVISGQACDGLYKHEINSSCGQTTKLLRQVVHKRIKYSQRLLVKNHKAVVRKRVENRRFVNTTSRSNQYNKNKLQVTPKTITKVQLQSLKFHCNSGNIQQTISQAQVPPVRSKGFWRLEFPKISDFPTPPLLFPKEA